MQWKDMAQVCMCVGVCDHVHGDCKQLVSGCLPAKRFSIQTLMSYVFTP